MNKMRIKFDKKETKNQIYSDETVDASLYLVDICLKIKHFILQSSNIFRSFRLLFFFNNILCILVSQRSLPVFSIHSFTSNCQLALQKKEACSSEERASGAFGS